MWTRVNVRVSEHTRDLVSAELLDFGASAIEDHGDMLTTYLSESSFTDEMSLRQRLRTVGGDIVSVEQIENQDWGEEWKKGLRPRRVGRIVVTPSWCRPSARDGELVIVVDPEMAFGTGEHGTTRGCLRLLQQVIRAGDRVLDVGTGSGILAIAAAHLGATSALGVESDIDAIENALDNVGRNHANDRATILHDLVTPEWLALRGSASFDLIVSNILSSVIVPLLPAFHDALAPGGRLIVSGILEQESQIVLSATHPRFAPLLEDLEDEWWSAAFRRA